MLKKLVSAITLLAIVGSLSMVSFAETSTYYSTQKNEANTNASQTQSQIDELDGQIDSVLQEVANLTASILQYETQISELSTRLNALETSIKEKEKPESINYEYFLKILKLCNEYQIPLVCISVPHPMSDDDVKKSNYIRDDVLSYPLNKCYYMYEEDIINPKTDAFKDCWHPNFGAAIKITKALGAYLDNNYNFTKHKDSEYWNKDYEDYCKVLKNQLLELDTLAKILQISMDRSMFSVTIETRDKSLIESDERFWELVNEADVQVIEGQGDGLCRVLIRDAETNELIIDKLVYSD